MMSHEEIKYLEQERINLGHAYGTLTMERYPVITNEEALAAQRYDQELVALAVDQTLRAGSDLFRERARANRLEQENDRLSSFERRTRNPRGDWVPE